MIMKEIVASIALKHKGSGIDVNRPASRRDIETFQQKIGFKLPQDFIEFYSICNGFGCTDDIFNMTPLDEIMLYRDHYGNDWFHFAEYMINLEHWSLRINGENAYEIYYTGEKKIVLTTSLLEFLERFFQGNVFEPGGLNEWREKLESKTE